MPSEFYGYLYHEEPNLTIHQRADKKHIHAIQRRIVELAKKGLEYERMRLSVGVEDVPVGSADRSVPRPPESVPVGDDRNLICCDRPMVDYGTFWSCMVCGKVVPK
jgi:hypothetical protein